MHSISTLLRGLLVPLMAGLLLASSVAPCQAFAPVSRTPAVISLDPCEASNGPGPAPVSCAQLACQVFLGAPTLAAQPILRQEMAAVTPSAACSAGLTFRPDVPPPRDLL